MICDLCATPDARQLFSTVAAFLTHISKHINEDLNYGVVMPGPHGCAFCGKTAASMYALKKHVYKYHGDQNEKEKQNNSILNQPEPINHANEGTACDDESINFDNPEVQAIVDDFEYDPPSPPAADTVLPPVAFVKMPLSSTVYDTIVTQAMALEQNPSVTRSVANDVIKGMVSVVEALCSEVALSVSLINGPEDALQMAAEIGEIPNKLAELKTEHLRHKSYEENDLFIQPSTRILDRQPELRHNQGNGAITHKAKSVETVSLVTLLTTLMQSKSFCAELLWPSSFTESEQLVHPFSGNRARKLMQDVGDDFIAIEIYGDEFETCNPLGAKKGKHKVLGEYLRILNLGPHLSSLLAQIFMIMVAPSKYLRTHRDTLFHWILADLKVLETDGIMAYDKKGEYRRIPVILFSSNGDNLYANEVGGFQMNFNGGRPCRACPLPYSELLTCDSLSEVVLRTVESYNASLKKDGKLSGIHRPGIFNDLKHFHCADAVLFDPMHDIAHGHGPWLLKRVFQAIIVIYGVLSLVELNACIAEFPFHGLDQAKKPTPLPVDLFSKKQQNQRVAPKRRRQRSDAELEPEAVSSQDNGKHISQSASQMLALILYLPLILKDYQDLLHELPEWQEFLNFQKIMDHVMSQKTSKTDIAVLTTLIERHLHFCITHWQDPIKPKAHFLLHYPQVMLNMGPIRHFWCFAYEAKHQPFKRYAASSFCYKNVSRSLAYKNQLTVMPFLKSLKDDSFASQYSSFAIHSKLYSLNSQVLLFSSGKPALGSVTAVTKRNGQTFLNLNNVKHVSFDPKLHCFVYNCESPNLPPCLVAQSDLIVPLPIILYFGQYFRVTSACLSK